MAVPDWQQLQSEGRSRPGRQIHKGGVVVAVEHRDAPPPAVLSAKPANQKRWLQQARIIPGQDLASRAL